MPVPAGRDGRDRGRELRREVPGGVPGAHRRRRLSVRRRVPAARRPRPRRAAHAPSDGHGARVSAELVSLTVDGTQVQVPKGTGLVEAALAAGVEIPVFCYGCTRFSEIVSEDNQLVARNRGSQSQIATFEDEPYRAHFSGNVIELCPVGALTSTQYRFEARPWEIQNVPTVCGMCPVGCNISATTREGKVKRILSRNHPEIDEGWLCDKGRFAFSHLYATDRVTEPRPGTGRRSSTSSTRTRCARPGARSSSGRAPAGRKSSPHTPSGLASGVPSTCRAPRTRAACARRGRRRRTRRSRRRPTRCAC